MGRRRTDDSTEHRKTLENMEEAAITQEALVAVEQDRQQRTTRMAALDEHQKLIAPYTDGLPYERDRVIVVARNRLYEAYSNAVECGKYLIWLQLEEGVQTFGQILNQHFPNISRSTAFNFMRLAKIAVEHPKMKMLVEKERSRVIALFEILDEDDIKELEDGGSVAGITLDEVEKIPVRELKDKLRSHVRAIERGKEQLIKLEEENKSLKQQLADAKAPPVYTSDEQKYIDIIAELGMDFERILLGIETRIAYKKGQVPEAALKKLYYLLVYIQRETLGERLNVSQHWEGADDQIPYEPHESELPALKEMYGELPHLRGVVDFMEKKAARAQQTAADEEASKS